MKRILTVLSLLCIPLFVSAENKIKMVTYFPVPYVAYSKINAQKQLDVGLTSACEMNLGCAESGALGTKPLQATTVNLNRGKLDLNTASAIKSTNVTLGSGSGEANIDFERNLRIATLQNGYSLESDAMTVDELKLFASHMRAGGEKFPSCAATGAAGAPQVSWQKLKLKNAEEVYLMCGTPKESVCNPPSGESTSQSCGSGYTGTQTRTWNYTTCKWNDWQGTCTPVKKDKWTYLGYYCTGDCQYGPGWGDDSLSQLPLNGKCSFRSLTDSNSDCSVSGQTCYIEYTVDDIDISQNDECRLLGYCYGYTETNVYRCQ